MRPRVVFRPVAALVLAALAAAMLASPIVASPGSSDIQPASASHKPDASVRVVKSHYHPCWVNQITGKRQCESAFDYTNYPSWQGVGVFNTTGKHQVARADFQENCCDEIHVFSVAVRNDGSMSDRFKVHAIGSGLSGWTVKYFKGKTNVTSAVVAGTFKTPLVAPGAQFLLKVKMSGKYQTETFDGYRLIKVASSADATKVDAVRLKLEHASWCYC